MPPRGQQAAARAQLVEVLQNNAMDTAALGVDAMRDLLPVLAEARAELNRDLAAWISQGKATDRWTPQAYRQSLLAIEASMQTAQGLLSGGLLSALVGGDAAARALANTATGRELLAYANASGVALNPSVPVKVAHSLVAGRNAPMARYETSAARYANDVARDIRRHLAVGVVRGENNDQLVARLRAHGGPRGVVATRGIAGTAGAVLEVIPEGLFARYEYWAERLVRTELAHAYTEQVQDIRVSLLDDFPDMVRRWDAAADMRTCPRCGAMHGTLSDPRTDKFPGDVDVPLHPNCVVAGTLIDTPHGPRAVESFVVGDVVTGGLSGRARVVLDTHRNPFEGELVVIEAGASVLRVTLNHPMLTSRGWVLAGELESSDELVRHRPQPGVAGADGGAAPPHDGPANSFEVRALRRVLGDLPRRGVPVPGVDLHRGALRGEGEVHVELPHGVLRHGAQPDAMEGREEDSFHRGELRRAGLPHGAALQVGVGALHPAHGGVGRGGESRAPVRALAGHAQGVGDGTAAGFEARREQCLDHGGAAASELLGNGEDGAFIGVQRAESDGVNIGCVHAHTLMQVQRIEHLSRERFTGEVFNLSVSVDESYVAAGLVAHNCRCRAGLFRPEWARHLPAGAVRMPPPGAPAAPPAPARVAPPPAPAPTPPPRPVARPRAPEAAGPAWSPPRPAPTPAPVAVAARVLSAPTGRTFTNALGALPTAEARMTALGVDAGAVSNAIGAVPDLTGAATFRVTTAAEQAAMTTVRESARTLLNRWCGVVTRDTPGVGTSRGGRGFWINDGLKKIHARASHTFTGVVDILREVSENARKGFANIAAGRTVWAPEWNAIRTILHEELHGCSPLLASACVRHGVVWEEITTEVLARAAIRDLSGLGEGLLPEAHFGFSRWSQDHWNQWHHDNAVVGSYARIIGRGVATLANEFHITPQEAVSLIERATILQRRAGGKRYATADGYVRDLARRMIEVQTGVPATPERVRKLSAVMSSTRFASTSGITP